ncbi:MAG: ImmA/IrrE family metallo-endopeptidase [Gemmatimonadaceae bacterium]
MTAKSYVKRAQSEVASLRHRLLMLQPAIDLERKVDVAEIASVACDCELVFVSQLSEARVFSVLQNDYGVDVGSALSPTHASLAGALCVATNGFFRWIFVRDEDSQERKRFTIAHELGHLFLEAMPELERAAASLRSHFFPSSELTELRLFSRCSETELTVGPRTESKIRTSLTGDDLREIHAHHFAAELLMPYEGVRLLVASRSGSRGIRSHAELDQLVIAVAERYCVSIAAARLRLEKDLAIVPVETNPNRDLFG